MDENEELEDNLEHNPDEKITKIDLEDGQRAVKGMYEDWFLDYASYVILERAVPHINDGLKPVQRRFLHAMKELDDGRYNKVANVIGTTMQYHPHGDAAIGGAIINMDKVYHGVATEMTVTDKDALIFQGLPEKFEAARYHSWIAQNEDFPEELKITAVDDEGGIMALAHKTYNVSAVQFHPESILTPLGEKMVRNFIDNLK